MGRYRPSKDQRHLADLFTKISYQARARLLPRCPQVAGLALHDLLGDGLTFIGPLVITLDLLDQLLHFLHLAFPLLLTHLRLAAEEFLVGLAVAATKSIPQCCVLAVVYVVVSTRETRSNLVY
jgi:hypothetical protein